MLRLAAMEPPPRPKMKAFVKANPEVPDLDNYSTDPGEEFWGIFPENLELDGEAPYPIKTDVLLELCSRYDYANMSKVEAVCGDIRFGADQLINRKKLRPTHNKNNESNKLTISYQILPTP